MSYKVGHKSTSRLSHEWTVYMSRPAPKAPLEKHTSCARCHMRSTWEGASKPCQIPPHRGNERVKVSRKARRMVQLALELGL